MTTDKSSIDDGRRRHESRDQSLSYPLSPCPSRTEHGMSVSTCESDTILNQSPGEEEQSPIGCCLFINNRQCRKGTRKRRNDDDDDHTRGFLYWCITILAL